MPADTIEAKLIRKHYGNVVEGPRGYAMPESVARKVEELSKGLPADCHYRRRAKAPAELRMELGERADVSLITTDAVDREHEVVLPKGGKWTDYNRVVTWCHSYGPSDGYNGLPVGSNLWIKPTETKGGAGLLAKTRYHAKPDGWGGDWLPDAILHLMSQDAPTCTGKSIGFIPLNIREASKKELENRPEWSACPVIDKWVGIEYAVAPVPANATCEMEAVSKSVKDAGTLAVIRAAMKTLAGEDAPPVAVEAAKAEEPSAGACPKCQSTNTAAMPDKPGMAQCKDCGHEWMADAGKFIDAMQLTVYRPRRIRDAIEQAARHELKALPALVAAEVRDILDRYMGRV